MKCLLCNKTLKYTITNKLRSGESRKVYYCEECDIGILDNKDIDLKGFYEHKYRKKYTPILNQPSTPEELFNIYEKYQQDRINLIGPHLKSDMTLLEIGCSAGQFLYHVKPLVKEIYGYELDKNCFKYAKKKTGCIKHTFKNENFDVICLFQTLEHIQNPIRYLGMLSAFLKPNGIIYIEVPNIHDALISAYNLPNHYSFYFHKAHLWYFSKKSLLSITHKFGFKGDIFFTQDYNILNHFNWILADAPQKSCNSGLSIPRLPLRSSTPRCKRIQEFVELIDENYKELLSELEITSNISFIGRRI